MPAHTNTTTYVCEVLEENDMLKVQNRELLARCDLLEAELRRYKKETEVILMTMDEPGDSRLAACEEELRRCKEEVEVLIDRLGE